MTQWGAVLITPDRARFRLWAPDQARVLLEVQGTRPIAMAREEGGWFAVKADAQAGSLYRFRLQDEVTVPDPASRQQSGGVDGWSVVVDQAAYRWQNTNWRGRPWEETVLQEVHVGALGGFSQVAEALPGLVDLGITAIELMPVNAFSGARNWGYDGVLPFAPHETYGSPDELKALVDRAHSLGMMIFLDVVYNHFGPDGNYLGAYASQFSHADVATPWGGAVAVNRPEVAAFFRENALMWLREYQFDGLRFDAVHAIDNEYFLDQLACELRKEIGSSRHVHLVLENERNDVDRLKPGGYDGQWNDDFHNVMHVLLTGETCGYYANFASRPTAALARCLAEGFIYQGEGSPSHDGRARGKPSGHLPTTAFVSFLQNHDQIGNRAMGERLTQLVEPDRLRAATALLLLSPHIPLLFMGDESGSETPFLFFTDFHDELADAVRNGRRREFAEFAEFADPKARERIPDPNDPATFARSKPRPGPAAAEWRVLYVTLLKLRRHQIVPRLKGARSLGSVVTGERSVTACWRMGDGVKLCLAINLGEAPVPYKAVDNPLFALGEPGAPSSFLAWIE